MIGAEAQNLSAITTAENFVGRKRQNAPRVCSPRPQVEMMFLFNGLSLAVEAGIREPVSPSNSLFGRASGDQIWEGATAIREFLAAIDRGISLSRLVVADPSYAIGRLHQGWMADCA